jgi:hypothetical protein
MAHIASARQPPQGNQVAIGREVGGKPERDEQPARAGGIGDECHDAAATAAWATQNVLGEHTA